MKWLRDLTTTGAALRLLEEELYAKALREIRSGSRRDGLWAKALAHAAGDEAKANALYIQYRVQSYKDEIAIATGSHSTSFAAIDCDGDRAPSRSEIDAALRIAELNLVKPRK